MERRSVVDDGAGGAAAAAAAAAAGSLGNRWTSGWVSVRLRRKRWSGGERIEEERGGFILYARKVGGCIWNLAPPFAGAG